MIIFVCLFKLIYYKAILFQSLFLMHNMLPFVVVTLVQKLNHWLRKSVPVNRSEIDEFWAVWHYEKAEQDRKCQENDILKLGGNKSNELKSKTLDLCSLASSRIDD